MVGLLRGCLGGVVAIVFSILSGIAIGREIGWLLGILSGFVILVGLMFVVAKIMNSDKEVTMFDCIIPTGIALISGVVFMPIGLLNLDIFSGATCIMSGAILSTCLWLHKKGKLSEWALIMPTLTFIYEILPIDLPTSLDNIIGLGGSATSAYLGYVRNIAIPASAKTVENFVDAVSGYISAGSDHELSNDTESHDCGVEDAEIVEEPLGNPENGIVDGVMSNARGHLKRRVVGRVSKSINSLTDELVDGVANKIDDTIDRGLKRNRKRQ